MTQARGWGLMELLVACALIGLVLAGILALLDSGTKAYLFGAKRVEEQQEARVAVEWFARIVRQSSAVVDADPHSVTLIDPAGLRVTFGNPQAEFVYLGADGQPLLNNGRDMPHMIRGVTISLGPFQTTATLRNIAPVEPERPGVQCLGGSYVPNGWNVFCR